MPPFPKPAWDTDFPVDAAREIKALRAHARLREVPKRSADKLLLATWNIANLGLQKRGDADYDVLAESSAGSISSPSRRRTTTSRAYGRSRIGSPRAAGSCSPTPPATASAVCSCTTRAR